ncbi:elongation of very long chain fatty acids protein 5-like [Tropilaelaps mercedesae]|uniref:Elongation of very long chain fatty acids protein n=1 Tax=Tropilaelaps mercedesae TaxID=418985 RepID=A0A1V9XB35_9ACAR|nr:elongation of very long chain fatty acids protein 5-like [Tropilaelaps mercedesae]
MMAFARFLPPRDSRTAYWFGAGDWMTLLYILCMYVGVVKILLPQYMMNRKEFKLLGIIRLYNLLLVGINVLFFYDIAKHTYFGGRYSWLCQGLRRDSMDMEVLKLNYYYMFVRIFEFLDTVFFILRKKFNQASVLNISHHCIAVILPWYGLAYGIDGQICLMVLVNMAVHVIMYSYYFLASFPAMQSYLGWKRYLTLIQIIQFVVVGVHMCVPLVYDCGYPVQSSLLVVSCYVYFLLMFAAFYGSTYQRKAKCKVEDNGYDEQLRSRVVESVDDKDKSIFGEVRHSLANGIR